MKNNVVGLRSWLEGNRKSEGKNGGKAPEDVQAQKIADQKIVEFVALFAETDTKAADGELLAGEVYSLYFKAPGEIQEQFITALCKEQGLTVPAAEETPRTRLIFAVYGKTEELVTMKRGEHDSKGGKRITAAIRAYNDSLTGKKRKRKERDPEVWPRTTRQFMADILAAAKPAEKKVLDRLIARVYGKEAVRKVA